MQEMQVQFLGQEDPLEKVMATHFSILAWRIPWTRAWQAIVHGVTKESEMTQCLNNNSNKNMIETIWFNVAKYFTFLKNSSYLLLA